MLMLGTTAKKASFSKNPPQDYIFYSVKRETKSVQNGLSHNLQKITIKQALVSWLALVG